MLGVHPAIGLVNRPARQVVAPPGRLVPAHDRVTARRHGLGLERRLFGRSSHPHLRGHDAPQVRLEAALSRGAELFRDTNQNGEIDGPEDELLARGTAITQ